MLHTSYGLSRPELPSRFKYVLQTPSPPHIRQLSPLSALKCTSDLTIHIHYEYYFATELWPTPMLQYSKYCELHVTCYCSNPVLDIHLFAEGVQYFTESFLSVHPVILAATPKIDYL